MSREQGGFQLMPFPFFQQPQQHRETTRQQEVPQRVQVAMEFCAMMMHKGKQSAIASDVAIEIIPGQPLTREETIAQASACQLLSAYFAGTVEMTAIELADHSIFIQKNHRGPAGGAVILCVACHNEDGKVQGCSLCRGNGRIVCNPIDKGGGIVE